MKIQGPFPTLRRLAQMLLFLAPAFVFGAWACLLFRLQLSQQLINLQSPRFHPYTLTTAGILLGLAFLFPLLFKPLQPVSTGPSLSLARKIFPVLWLLLPLGAFFMLPSTLTVPNALLDRAWATATARSSGSSGEGRVDPATVKNFILNSDPDIPLDLSQTDLLIVQKEPELQEVLKKRQVELLGQWMPMEKGAANEFRLARLVMVCCAADARPVSVLVQGDTGGAKLGDWFLATGRLDFNDPRETILLKAEDVHPVDEPEDIFLY